VRHAADRYYQYNLSDQILIEEFDGICAFDFIEHIDDDRGVLKNMYAALKLGGVPADQRLWSAMDRYAEHKRRYSRKELLEKVEGNGFKVIKLSYFMALLYTFILFLRKLSFRIKSSNGEVKRQVKNEVMTELQPNVIVNFLGFLIFSLEVLLIDLVTLPFRSSLVCVAVKEL
jgi:hypothetical protein